MSNMIRKQSLIMHCHHDGNGMAFFELTLTWSLNMNCEIYR